MRHSQVDRFPGLVPLAGEVQTAFHDGAESGCNDGHPGQSAFIKSAVTTESV